MIFAASNFWLDISINLLLVVFVIVCLLMALLILMQRPKQEGLGAAFGGGVTDQVFGARTTNVLQRGTVYLGSLFFILSMTLAILIGKQTKQKSLLEPKKAVAEKSAPKVEGKVIDVLPSPSLVEQLPIEVTPAPTQPAPTIQVVEPAPTIQVVEPAPPAVEPAPPAVETPPTEVPAPPTEVVPAPQAPGEKAADKPE